MAAYPNNIPAFSTPGATLSSPPHSTQHTAVNGEVIAICSTLGTNPQGTEATVKDRLEAIEASIGSSGHMQNTDDGTTKPSFYINGITGPYLYGVAGNLQLKNAAGSAYVNLTLLDLNVQGSITDGLNIVTVADIKTASNNQHTHANKATLDTYSQSEVNLASAVALKHTQNTDTGTNVETFQLNNTNVNSSRIKVDDLTPQYVDIVNATDTGFADIRAAIFRGSLGVQNLDVPPPLIRYNDTSNEWEMSNDGVTFSPIATFNPAISGTTSDTFTINTDGFSLEFDTTGMGANRVVNGEDLYQAVQQRHNAATAGTGISVGGGSGQVITNTAPDQTVAFSGGTNVTIGGTYPNFTITDNSQVAGSYQAADAGLTSLAGLTFVSTSFVKMTAADTFGLDTTVYLPQTLNSARIFVGNGSNIATGVAMTGDVSIDNTGLTAVADDSHNHTSATVTLALNDLSDVIIAAPATDQILKYNGTNWVNGPETVVNGGSGVDYFYDTTASDIATYETLNKAPQSIVEQDQTVVVNNNTQLIKAFASANTGIGGTQIDAGVWTFDIWAYTSDATNPTNIQIEILSRTEPGGVETSLFTVTSPNLTTSQALYTIVSIQQAYVINPTDRLVAKVSASTTNLVNTTVHFAFGGTTHYSHFNTPLVLRHNDLAGLQGGTATERYHMTQAQNTALHAAVTISDTASVDLSLTGQLLSADVLPGGVNHDALLNFSANQHIDHTTVSISAGTGLTGGGDISANRTISLSHLGFQNLTDPNANRLIIWDDTDGSLQWVTLGTNLSYDHATHTISATGGATLTRATFTNATLSSGVLTITHSAGLSAPYTVLVMIFDNNGQQIIPDSVTGSANSVAVDLSSYVTAGGGSIAGTWGYGYIA